VARGLVLGAHLGDREPLAKKRIVRMRPHLLFVAVLSLLPAGAGGFISPLVRGGGKLQEKRACILHQHVVASAGIGSVSGVQRSRSATSTHLSASVSEGQDQEYQQQHKLAAVSAGDSQKIEQPGARIVLCAGFEAFNLQLYRSVADELLRVCPQLHLEVFTDRDIAERSSVVSAALESADAVFISLVFDFDQVQFLRKNIESVRIRLVFESALELMELTKIGEFTMKGGGGPPAPIKALLSKFGSGKEEDRLAGYLQLLKVGPSLLKMVPGTKAKDLQSWLELYSYWNQGGLSNVLNLFLMLGDRYLLPEGTVPPATALKETPSQGLVHPQSGGKFFETPAQFLRWYEKSRGLEDGYKYAPPGAPVVALLLYRKHVITQQRYISQLISGLEEQGILPLPIFINGVEAHTVVRDMLTSENEQRSIREGRAACPTLSTEAVSVEAIVNTIGFPLVGGPAGSMEAGRRVDVATDILSDMVGHLRLINSMSNQRNGHFSHL
jgi:magnesium chelatase subunit H